MTVGELAHTTVTWQQAHFGAVMSGSLWLSCSNSDKIKSGEKIGSFSQTSDPVEVQKSQLDGIRGTVCTTQKVTIPPFHMVNIKANASVKGHCMKVHVLTEPALGPQLPSAVVPIATYGELHPGSTRVPVCLHNLCHRDSSKNSGWSGYSCQPGTTGGPPNQDCQRDNKQSIQRVGLGGFRPPGPKRVAWVRVEMG